MKTKAIVLVVSVCLLLMAACEPLDTLTAAKKPRPVPTTTTTSTTSTSTTTTVPHHPTTTTTVPATSGSVRNAAMDTSPGYNMTQDQLTAAVGIYDGKLMERDTDPNYPRPLEGNSTFYTACNISHLNYDDPIVYPGQVKAAHLHTYFGNTKANAHTNKDSLLSTGGGSCSGGAMNRSAYWVPTMIDNTGGARVPSHMIVYYKSTFLADTKPIPQGLKMLAGDPNATSAQPLVYVGGSGVNGQVGWSCTKGPGWDGSTRWVSLIPDCVDGAQIHLQLRFPNCWDGINLDSANHRTHVYGLEAA